MKQTCLKQSNVTIHFPKNLLTYLRLLKYNTVGVGILLRIALCRFESRLFNEKCPATLRAGCL